jgi:hypothetical protein
VGELGYPDYATGCHLHFEVRDSSDGFYNDVDPTSWLSTALSNVRTVSGDFNGDGFKDFAVMYDYGSNATGIWVWLGKSDGTFQSPARWWYGTSFTASLSKIVAGDFNGDGYDDLAVLYNYGSATSGIWVWSGSSTGFTGPVREWYGTQFDWNASKVTAGDFNGDGYDDFGVVYNYGPNTTGIFSWQGSSSGLHWAIRTWYATSFDWTQSKVTAADFNADGYDDLAILYNYGSSTSGIWVWLGGTAPLQSTNRWWYGTSFDWNASNVIAADFNGAFKLPYFWLRYNDFGVAFNYGNSVGIWVWQGQPGSGFQSPQLWWQGSTLDWGKMKIAAGDFDGDYRDDFAALYDDGAGGSQIWVWRGQAGTSGFASPTEPWASTSFSWLASQVV